MADLFSPLYDAMAALRRSPLDTDLRVEADRLRDAFRDEWATSRGLIPATGYPNWRRLLVQWMPDDSLPQPASLRSKTTSSNSAESDR